MKVKLYFGGPKIIDKCREANLGSEQVDILGSVGVLVDPTPLGHYRQLNLDQLLVYVQALSGVVLDLPGHLVEDHLEHVVHQVVVHVDTEKLVLNKYKLRVGPDAYKTTYNNLASAVSKLEELDLLNNSAFNCLNKSSEIEENQVNNHKTNDIDMTIDTKATTPEKLHIETNKNVAG